MAVIRKLDNVNVSQMLWEEVVINVWMVIILFQGTRYFLASVS